MKKNCVVALLVSGTVAFSGGIAGGEQEYTNAEIVVTASRIESPLREVSGSVTVIGSNRIEGAKSLMMVDIVRDAPGLYVAQSGGAGKVASVYIRGAKSEQTLFLIDGVEMNDPIAAAGSYGLDHLLLNTFVCS